MISPVKKELLELLVEFETQWYKNADYGVHGDMPPINPKLTDLLIYARVRLGNG